MKKKKLSIQRLSLGKTVITGLAGNNILGGATGTGGGTGTAPASTPQAGCTDTISICNDECAVTWGCPPKSVLCPDYTQVYIDSVCVRCNATNPTQSGC